MFRSAILLLLLTLPLRANLGETVEQCVQRYGKPIGFSEANANTPFGTLVFTASNYTLVVFLLNKTEVGARVTKTDKSAFTNAEMQLIMNADTNGTQWTPSKGPDPTTQQWTRPDQSTVFYDTPKHVLIFTSPQMAAALNPKSN